MSLNFYPNPVKNYLTIELYELTGITDLTIFNVDGIELLEQPITEHKTNIDIRNWPQGVYFLKVTNERNVTVCKIIKE